MARHYLFLLSIALIAFFTQACSSPTQHVLEHYRTPEKRYKRVEDFTTEWFVNNVRDDVLARYSGTGARFHNALFYTRHMSKTAIEYACKENRITIWEPWHRDLYNDSNSTANEYSCIHYNATARNYFFGNISEAFAKLSTDYALVMHSKDDYKEPPEDGIWATVERPVIFGKQATVERLHKLREMEKSTLLAIWDSTLGDIKKAQDPIKWLKDLNENVKTYLALFERIELRSADPAVDEEDAAHGPWPACQPLPTYTLEINW